MVEDTLRELGLNDKEIKIYLSLLPLGSAPASILGKRTKITRSTAQYSCQQLVKKGLISVIEKNNSFIYTPESPDKIIYLLEQQKKEIENKEAQVNRIIGNLKNMMSTSAVLPKVQFFEGKQGIIDAFGKLKKDISENHKVSNEILNYVDPVSEDFDQKIIDTVYDLVNYRIKHKVKARLITADGKIPKLL
jgi:sugar-specific transcriptional regulator TrmB